MSGQTIFQRARLSISQMAQPSVRPRPETSWLRRHSWGLVQNPDAKLLQRRHSLDLLWVEQIEAFGIWLKNLEGRNQAAFSDIFRDQRDFAECYAHSLHSGFIGQRRCLEGN